LVLERPDLPADRRLGQVQPLRGAREALRLGDGAKRAQLRELHVRGPFPFVPALLRGCPTNMPPMPTHHWTPPNAGPIVVAGPHSGGRPLMSIRTPALPRPHLLAREFHHTL